ncbi:MAG: hypothetical protein ACREUE_00685 [Panacagrimonas sp.]
MRIASMFGIDLTWLFRGAVICAALITGCGSIGSSPSPPAPRRGVIGVVSVLGAELDAVRVSPPTDPVEHYKAQVDAWRVDRLTAGVMVEQLRVRGHATTQLHISLPLDRIYRPSEYTADSGLLNVEALAAVARDARVSTLIVIRRVAPDKQGPHQQFFQGAYGLYHRELFGIRRSSVYALIGVDVVDANHATVVAKHRVAAWGGWSDQLPAWSPRFADLSLEDRAALRNRIQSHLVGQVKAIASEIQL